MKKVIEIKYCNDCPYKNKEITKSLIAVKTEESLSICNFSVDCNLKNRSIKSYEGFIIDSNPPGFFDNIKIPDFCPLKNKSEVCKKKKKNQPNKLLKKAAKFYRKMDKYLSLREDIIKYKVNNFYIYRLRNPENKNLHVYEIGVVKDPWKYDINYIFNWTDVNNRCCEGFWGDRPLVEDFVNAMNINLVNKKKNE